MFVDLTLLSAQATEDALEYIYKSTSSDDKGAGIWNPHESLLIRRLIELFTQRGLLRLQTVQAQLQAWESGANHVSSTAAPTPPGMMERWTPAELDLVKLYLESLPPEKWTLDDHMMAVDFVVQRYLPADELKTEAQWLATRSGLMGKVQANLGAAAAAALTAKQADAIVSALPLTPAQAAVQFQLNPQQQACLEFGAQRAAENVRALTDKARHQLRQSVLLHLEEQQTTPAGQPGQALQSKLLDEFASLNRDWRRIAVTEAGECQTQGFIASLKPGTKVKRIEQYATACAFCKKIHGVVATVVAADHPDKDSDTMVWPGKNNSGRSAAPRKRVGDQLIPRTKEEMWHLPAGLAHPHCRGRWVIAQELQEGDDPDFADFLTKVLGGN